MKRSLLSDERGSVMTEGVIVVFFLILVFGFLMFEYRLHVSTERLSGEVRRDIDAEVFEPSTNGYLDAERVSFLEPALPAAERWVPERAQLVDTLRRDSPHSERMLLVERPTYLGGGVITGVLEEDRARDEPVRGGQGSNWPALFDTWCRVGMCAAGGDGPPLWDHAGPR